MESGHEDRVKLGEMKYGLEDRWDQVCCCVMLCVWRDVPSSLLATVGSGDSSAINLDVC